MTEVFGQQNPGTSASEYNALAFVVGQLLQKMQTVTLVRVVAVSNDGGVSPVGTVDVQPLVNQMSGDRKPTPHGTVYGVPYFRLQGGTDAVILDPKVGDIGMCAFASRDISAVKVAKAPANPGSFRMYDWADGLYFGGLLNGAPTQYVRFYAGGVDVVSPGVVTIQAPTVAVEGDLTVSGTVVANGDVTGAGISLQTHLHSGVMAGGANSGPPVP
jgi:hypothetical protein